MLEKLPASHAMQLEVPFWSCQDPAAHCMQYVEPALEYDPLSHNWQALSSTAPIDVEKLPHSHEMQLEVPFWSCQDPPAHSMQ